MEEAEKPFFSVIIPAYNSSRFILSTLDSVFEQIFPDYEIIVVDDGSTDNTQELLATINDSRLRIITQKNAGAAVARNRGICEARGEFLAFLDADDVWLPYHLSVAKRFFENYPEHAWYSSRCRRVESESIGVCKIEMRDFDQLSVGYCLCNWFLETDILECGSNFVIKRSHAREWGAFYPEGIVLWEDNIAWCRLAMRHPMMGVPDCCTVLYRMWPGSAIFQYGKTSEILQKSLRPVFRFHRALYSSPSCSVEAKLFFKRFACNTWCACLKRGGAGFWLEQIKEHQVVTGVFVSFFLRFFSCLPHWVYRGAGKLLSLYIYFLDSKIYRLAKKYRVEGLS